MTINTNIKISPGNSKMEQSRPSACRPLRPAVTASAKKSATQPSWSV